MFLRLMVTDQEAKDFLIKKGYTVQIERVEVAATKYMLGWAIAYEIAYKGEIPNKLQLVLDVQGQKLYSLQSVFEKELLQRLLQL